MFSLRPGRVDPYLSQLEIKIGQRMSKMYSLFYTGNILMTMVQYALLTREYQQSAVQEHIRREGEAPPPEDLYDKENHRPARFKTQIKDLPDLKENDAAHFECKLLPLGDPTMKVEWYKDGEPLHHGE